MAQQYPSEKEAALRYRSFLTPLLSQGNMHDDVVELWAQRAGVKKKTAQQTLWRMENHAYPTAANVERAAFGLQAHYPWAWSPVLFYASGSLESFVKVVATVNFTRIASSRLLEILKLLPAVINGDGAARKRWELEDSEPTAFLSLEDAEGHMTGRPQPDDVVIALALCDHWEIPYDLLRERVLGLLISWVAGVAAKSTVKARIQSA